LRTLAQIWGFLQRGTPTRLELQALHVSLGLLLILVLVLRIGWRLGPSRRLPPAETGLPEVAARAMQLLDRPPGVKPPTLIETSIALAPWLPGLASRSARHQLRRVHFRALLLPGSPQLGGQA
jgi:hypothetical protein